MFHAGFESLETVPAVFVFMGNFQSYPATSASTDYDAVKQNFSALAAVLQRHRRLAVSVTLHPAHTLPESWQGRAGNRWCCKVGVVIRNDPEQGRNRLHGHVYMWSFSVHLEAKSGRTTAVWHSEEGM